MNMKKHWRGRLVQTYCREDLPGLHQVPLLRKHCCHTIGGVDVVLILSQNSVEVLQGFEEAVMDLLQGLCSLGVPPAPGIAPLGGVLVHMKLAGLEVEHRFQQQGIGVMLAGRQLQNLVDVLLGFTKVFPVQIQLAYTPRAGSCLGELIFLCRGTNLIVVNAQHLVSPIEVARVSMHTLDIPYVGFSCIAQA